MTPDKRRALIEALARSPHPLSGEELAGQLHVSSRSVRTYVAKLNARGTVIVTSHRGYALDPRARARLANLAEPTASVDTPDRRLEYLCRLLSQASAPVNVHTLADKLYVSNSTIESDLSRAREVFREHELTLNRDHENVWLDGPERSRRRVVRQMMQQGGQGIVPTWQAFSREYAHLDLTKLRATVSQIVADSDLELNEYALSDVLLHIAVTVERVRDGHTLPAAEWPLRRKDRLINEVTELLASAVDTQFHITLPPSEHEALYGVLAVRAVRIADPSAAEAVVDPQMKVLVAELLELVASKYLLGPADPSMLLKLTLHVQNLVARCRSNLALTHPLGEAFKNSHPLVHDLALDFAQRLEKRLTIDINGAEVDYLAMHMGMQYLHYLEQRDLLTITLVVPHYYDMASAVADTLERSLRGRAIIEDVETTLDFDFSGVTSDLIVSCVEPRGTPSAPVVQVSPLLPRSDIATVSDAVNAEMDRNMRRRIRTTLFTLIDPALFMTVHALATKEDALALMSTRLVEEGYVDDNFLDDVLDRERRSSTSFGGEFAIPHSMRMDASATAISVLVSDKGIPWGSSLVRLVFLFALSPDGRQAFRDGLDQIIKLLSERGSVSALVAAGADADTFLAALRDLLDR